MPEFGQYLLSAAGGALIATWGMIGWTNGRLRKLELDRVTPADCAAHISSIAATDEQMWKELRRIGEAVARIEGKLDQRQ